jgi:hypothetical protein
MDKPWRISFRTYSWVPKSHVNHTAFRRKYDILPFFAGDGIKPARMMIGLVIYFFLLFI